jgi:hypothetical protein
VSVYRLSANPDRLEEAMGNLPQTDRMPFKRAILKAFVAESVELETALFALIAGRWLGVAAGVHLDKLGALLKEGRKGRSDTAYRLALRVVIRARRSAGKVDDVLDVLDLLGLDYSYREWPRARLSVEVFGAGSVEVAGWVRRIRLGGVLAHTIYTSASRATSWTLESVHSLSPKAGNVFQSIHSVAVMGYPLATVRVS